MLYRALITAACVLIAAPALAFESKCAPPYAPVVPNGSTATADQINTAATEVKAFIAKSDSYQDCLNIELQAQKDDAAKNKNDFDTKIEDTINQKRSANQREKERLGAEYNAAAHTYVQLHKKPQAQ